MKGLKEIFKTSETSIFIYWVMISTGSICSISLVSVDELDAPNRNPFIIVVGLKDMLIYL